MLLTHTCGRTTYHGLTSVTYLENKYWEDIRIKPDINVGDFMRKVNKELGVSITAKEGDKEQEKDKQVKRGEVESQDSKTKS